VGCELGGIGDVDHPGPDDPVVEREFAAEVMSAAAVDVEVLLAAVGVDGGDTQRSWREWMPMSGWRTSNRSRPA